VYEGYIRGVRGVYEGCIKRVRGVCEGCIRGVRAVYERCIMASRMMHVALPCGATLVVCPAPILPQWRSELARHAAPGAIKAE